MPGLLSSADLAVFPSLMEATSVAALESMACELPVAASRVGGLPEIVDEDVGILVEPADPSSLARGVLRLLESPRLAALGKAARDRVVARWTNDRLVERHVAVYEDVVAQRRAA
jgi:glycosyltransferase involved in cell wall biosynthesis